ncbi:MULTISPECIES: TonB-dependent receptor [unclassified Sphingobium]|uniref:TonB-dependent receptor n=1 Tax=unclassified Sphingobium TaxID=2611147 RepID=UPI0035A60610
MNASRKTHLGRTVLLGSAACLMTAPAFAQDDAATAAPQDEARSSGLEDIIVTARRKTENLQNIPVAASVVSEAQIQNYGINSIEKVANLAPQLIIGRNGSGNGAAIGLRGISVNATSISLEQSVAIVIDGVYYSGGRALNMGMFDLAQVEVLKGPQSLFYGKNTTAGALSFTTASPTRELQGMLRTGYEFNGQNPYVEGYISGPVTDTLSLRLASRYSKQFDALIRNVSQGGTTYTRDVVTGISTPHTRPDPKSRGEETFTTRLTALWEPTDNFTANVKATYNKYSSATPNSAAVIGVCEARGVVQTDPTAPCGHKFVQVQSGLPNDIAQTQSYTGRRNGNPYLTYEAYNFTGNFEYKAGAITFSLTPAYTHSLAYWAGDFDFTDNYLSRDPALGTGGNFTGTREQQKAFSLEGRARSDFGGILNFMVGGYYQSQDTYFDQENNFPGGVENSAVTNPRLRYLSVLKDAQTRGKTYSVFGQAILDITPELNITGGIRYSHEKKDSIQAQPYVHPSAQGSFKQTTALTQFVVPQTFNNTSPEATISYKITPAITAYASYRTGYKSGGYSISGTIAPASTVADGAFNPEKVKGFEGGIKSTLFGNQVRANFDMFSYNYDGLQMDFFNPLTIQYLTLNAASARTRGAELDVEYAPRAIDGLNIKASLAYTDAKYKSFPAAPCLSGQNRAEGCRLGANALGNGTRQDLGGQSLPQAPKWTGTLGVNYDTDLGSSLKGGFSGNMRYSSRYKTYGFAPDDTDRFYQKSFATIDASIRVGAQDDSWQLQLIGKNLTNRFIVSSAFDLTYTGSGTGSLAGTHADTRTSIYDPRTVAIEATVRF